MLAALLARLRSRPDRHAWTVGCRAERGRRASLLISLTGDGITITATASGPWLLTLPELERLRDVSRDARLTLGLAPGTGLLGSGRRIAPRRIVIRERHGGQGSSLDLALPTGFPPPHRQPDPPMALNPAGW
ncbi:MAG: hypothetical protein ACRDSR_24110 [Pseudonocardiaceae bacterium]